MLLKLQAWKPVAQHQDAKFSMLLCTLNFEDCFGCMHIAEGSAARM